MHMRSRKYPRKCKYKSDYLKREQRKDRGRKFIQKLTENFANLVKHTNIQVQEDQRSPNRLSANKTTLRCPTLKDQQKRKDTKRSKRKKANNVQRNSETLAVDFLVEMLRVRKGNEIFKLLKKKN